MTWPAVTGEPTPRPFGESAHVEVGEVRPVRQRDPEPVARERPEVVEVLLGDHTVDHRIDLLAFRGDHVETFVQTAAAAGAFHVSPNQHCPCTGKAVNVTPFALGAGGAGAAAWPSLPAVWSSILPVTGQPFAALVFDDRTRGARTEDTVGASRHIDAGGDQRLLQGLHPVAAFAVHGVADRVGDRLRCRRVLPA